MKKLVVLIIAVALSFGTAIAMNSEADFSKTYENSKGTVTFNHAAHVEKLGDGDCASCHEMIQGFTEVNRDYGHKFCKSCHLGTNKEYGTNAPTVCTGCHIK